nr:sigma factor [Nocardioides flavescens]
MLLFPEDAEEATQDALLLVATRIHTSAGQSRFTTWLHAVASNSARMTYRSLERRAAERPTDELPVHADPRTTSVIAAAGSTCSRRSRASAPTTRSWSSPWCCATSSSSTTRRSRGCSTSRSAP